MSNINKLNNVAVADLSSVDGHNSSAIASINGQDLVTTSFLLDTYGADVRLAYSVRKLSSTYSGAAIRVREGLFNTEVDIGFDSSGNLDEAALLAHCASNGTGYITRWYDQSGNGGNVQQTTAANQPQIVAGNAVLKSNGKPVIEGNNASSTTHLDLISKATYLPATGQYYFFSVCNTNTQSLLYAENQPNKWQLAAHDGNTSTSIRSPIYSANTYRRNGASYSPSNRNVLHDDNTSQTLITIDGNLTVDPYEYRFRLGYFVSPWDMWDMQEFIVYQGDKSSIQSDIETAINSYYSIYP